MKKIILVFILVIIIFLTVGGGIFVFAKDSPMFDVFFSEKDKTQRELNRLSKLFPEKIENFSIYSWSAEKIQKDSECGEINETLNSEGREVNAEICTITTKGQYRDENNNTIFVHLIKITKGKEDPGISYLFGKISQAKDKLGNYNVMRPENHEISWFPENPKIDLIITQEGVARKNPDGGESMLYQKKASGDNPVTQYFILKFPPLENSQNVSDFSENNNTSLSPTILNFTDCVKRTEIGVDGSKLCGVIRFLQGKNFTIYPDSIVRKSESEGAVAQVDIDIILQNDKAKSNGDIFQMTSSEVAKDLIKKFSAKNSDYEKISIEETDVLKFLRNGEITFVFSNEDMIYELQNIDPLYEMQFIEVLKVILR